MILVQGHVAQRAHREGLGADALQRAAQIQVIDVGGFECLVPDRPDGGGKFQHIKKTAAVERAFPDLLKAFVPADLFPVVAVEGVGADYFQRGGEGYPGDIVHVGEGFLADGLNALRQVADIQVAVAPEGFFADRLYLHAADLLRHVHAHVEALVAGDGAAFRVKGEGSLRNGIVTDDGVLTAALDVVRHVGKRLAVGVDLVVRHADDNILRDAGKTAALEDRHSPLEDDLTQIVVPAEAVAAHQRDARGEGH